MREIELTQGYVALVDDSDYPELLAHGWCIFGNLRRRTQYAMATIDSRGVYMHRHIMGITDSETVVHHRNGNGLDNRRANLEIMSASEHSKLPSRHRRNPKSGYRGVHKNPHCASCFEVRVRAASGKNLYLGTYETGAEAARAYDDYVVEHFGANAICNGVTQEDVEAAKAEFRETRERENERAHRLAERLSLVAAQIRARRLSRGMTQKQLGAKVGINHTMISHWEHGGRPIMGEYIPRLCACLGEFACLNVIEEA